MPQPEKMKRLLFYAVSKPLHITLHYVNAWRGLGGRRKKVVISYQQIVEANLKVRSLNHQSVSRL